VGHSLLPEVCLRQSATHSCWVVSHPFLLKQSRLIWICCAHGLTALSVVVGSVHAPILQTLTAPSLARSHSNKSQRSAEHWQVTAPENGIIAADETRELGISNLGKPSAESSVLHVSRVLCGAWQGIPCHACMYGQLWCQAR